MIPTFTTTVTLTETEIERIITALNRERIRLEEDKDDWTLSRVIKKELLSQTRSAMQTMDKARDRVLIERTRYFERTNEETFDIEEEEDNE